MPQCSAINCANRPEKGFKLFRFPSDESRQQKWIEYCGRKDWVPTRNSALCELHFSEDQFRSDRLVEGVKQLNRDAIPSVLVQPKPGLATSRGRKKSALSSHTQNLITEKTKKKQDPKCESQNIDSLQPLVKKTKRWTHLPKVDWSYDHLYSKRQRIYFEIVESSVLTGEAAGKSSSHKSQVLSPTSPAFTNERLFDDRLQGKVEEVWRGSEKFCNDLQSEMLILHRPIGIERSNLNIRELKGAIQDAVQAKTELRRHLVDLCGFKENAESRSCRNVEMVCSDSDDRHVLDLNMTVDEVDEGCVADGEGSSDARVELDARAGLTKRLEELELLEKALKRRLTQEIDAEKLTQENFSQALDEFCRRSIAEEGEHTQTERNVNFPWKNTITSMLHGKVLDSVMETPSVSQNVDDRNHRTLGAVPAAAAAENETTESSGETSSSSFVCENCGKVFSSFYQMRSHQRLHLVKKRQPRVCYICHKAFLLLGRHLRTHSGERPYRCGYCHRQFSRLDNLQNHIRSHINRARKRLACDRCGAEFSDRHEWRVHQRVHRGETPYSCVHCDRQFLYQNVWRTHLQSHLLKKQFLCNVCGKQFVQANNLKDHIASVHSGEKSHRCLVCGKSFVRAMSLRLHANSHTGERPHSCDRCNKSFVSPGSLSAHMRIHYGETPFVCCVCRKCFRYSCHLKIHMRVHTGEKPYQCSTCSKFFAQNGNLKEHQRVHSHTATQDETSVTSVEKLSLTTLRVVHK